MTSAELLDTIESNPDKLYFELLKMSKFISRRTEFLIEPEDIAAEAFLRIFKSRENIDNRGFKTFCWQVCRNIHIDYLRKLEKKRVGISGVENGYYRKQYGQDERLHYKQILESFQSDEFLNQVEISIVKMLMRGLTYKEMCDESGLKLGTLKNAIHRLRHKLRRILDKFE